MFTAKQIWVVLSRVLAWLGLALWLGHFYFWYAYFDSSPPVPDYRRGQVIPLNNHGNVHYLTDWQDHNIRIMQMAAFALIVASVLVAAFIRFATRPKALEK
jgi:energy-coupling factor transporter transmembrane protein EcfT